MPSHADRVRRHYQDVDPRKGSRTAPDAVPGQAFADLERYAGWLGKDHVSVEVRANVRALGAAMGSGNDTLTLVETLTKDIGRLPGGDLRKMLQNALARLSVVPDPGGIGVRSGEGS